MILIEPLDHLLNDIMVKWLNMIYGDGSMQTPMKRWTFHQFCLERGCEQRGYNFLTSSHFTKEAGSIPVQWNDPIQINNGDCAAEQHTALDKQWQITTGIWVAVGCDRELSPVAFWFWCSSSFMGFLVDYLTCRRGLFKVIWDTDCDVWFYWATSNIEYLCTHTRMRTAKTGTHNDAHGICRCKNLQCSSWGKCSQVFCHTRRVLSVNYHQDNLMVDRRSMDSESNS